jgi:hypothetical protein
MNYNIALFKKYGLVVVSQNLIPVLIDTIANKITIQRNIILEPKYATEERISVIKSDNTIPLKQ